MNEKYFKNKNAVITGAASGIGRTLALELAKMGTSLVISDINLERLEKVKEEVEAYKVKVVSKKCDVTKKSDVKSLRDVTLSNMQDVHFLFSNAGIAAGGHIESFSNEIWRNVINVNIWGMINLVNAFIPKMVEQGFGHIIVTSSIAGIIGAGGLIPYSTSKFANFGFCEALYGEFKDKGIDVNKYSQEQLAKGFEFGKEQYWNEFTKGGYELDRAIHIYLKKIVKKKLYICERKKARFIFFIKGLWPNYYKKLVSKIGAEHINVLDESTQKAINFIENI